jgi:hypothetical protein
MATDSRLEASREYDTLRNELLEAKRYVFERPLAITAFAAIAVQHFDKPEHIAVPISVAVLTLLNFWFTANRLQSASRIVAYIHLVLEPSAVLPWRGWETSLREYRKWLRSLSRKDATKLVDAKLDTSASPDALMYYPPIYFFHTALMACAVVAAGVQIVRDHTALARVFGAGAVGVGALSLTYFYRLRPSRVRLLIERNRVIWLTALNNAGSEDTDMTGAASSRPAVLFSRVE